MDKYSGKKRDFKWIFKGVIGAVVFWAATAAVCGAADLTVTIQAPDGTTLSGDGLALELMDMDGEAYGSDSGGANPSTFSGLSTGLYELWVEVDETVHTGYGPPEFMVIDLETASQSVAVLLLERNIPIRGMVSLDGDPFEGMPVGAYDLVSGAYHETETDANGLYEIMATEGIWEVMPNFEIEDVLPADPEVVEPEIGGVYDGVDFNLTSDNNASLATIQGTITDQSGTTLDALWAEAYAMGLSDDEWDELVDSVLTENGAFTLKVPPGTYDVGLWIDFYSEYEFGETEEKTVTVEAGDTATVAFTLGQSRAAIQGNVTDINGQPLTGVGGVVFADKADGDVWREGQIDAADGSFSIANVTDGDWYLTVYPDSMDYAPFEEGVPVTVPDQQTPVSIALTGLGQTISGIVYESDGATPAVNVWVWARWTSDDNPDRRPTEEMALTDASGQFSFQIPENTEVTLGALAVPAQEDGRKRLKGSDQANSCSTVCTYRSGRRTCTEVCEGKKRSVRMAFRADDPVVLTLRKATGQLTGAVVLDSVAVDGAFVTAYSQDSQSVSGYTGADGGFSLPISPATDGLSRVWSLRAAYDKEGAYYQSPTALLDISETLALAAPLVLTKSGNLPGQQKTALSWDRNIRDVFSADGARIDIPQNALTKSYGMTVLPLMGGRKGSAGGLPDTWLNRPIRYGYAVSAYYLDAKGRPDQGSPIRSLARKATFSLPYTDADLSRLGVSETDLRPAYRLPEGNGWKPMETFSVDAKAKTVMFQTDRISEVWALLAVNNSVAGTLTGNVNGIGGIDLADVLLALKIAAGASISADTPIYTAADVNADLKIGLAEAIYDLRFISGLP